VAADGSQELGPGAVLDERYRVTEALASGKAWLGADIKDGKEVLVLEVSSAHGAALKPAVTLNHQHLAQVLAVLERDDRHLVVTERVPGISLRERLNEIGAKSAVDAVRTALRAADALTSLHDHGAVHGLVHDRALIVAHDSERALPVLNFWPPEPVNVSRAPGGDPLTPTVADDAWAVAALLHEMLTGKAPPVTGYADVSELADEGVVDSALQASLFHGLSSNAELRSHDLRPLRRELARWFVEHAAEETIPPTTRHSKEPPPLPSTVAPREAAAPFVTTSPAPAKRKSSHLGALAVGAIGLGLIGGWVFSALRPKKPEVELVPVPATARPAPAPSASAIELTDVPVTGENEGVMEGDKLGSCVAGYLPPNTFGKAPDLAFVCSESDPRNGAEKLHGAVVTGAPRGQVTEAMKIFAKIGWYDMAAFAVVRAGCCPDAAPLGIPKLSDSCSKMDESLREVGDAVVAMKPVEPALKKYTESIHCELNSGRSNVLRRKERPAGGEDTAFLELVKKLEAH
jgi:hypothetical protein